MILVDPLALEDLPDRLAVAAALLEVRERQLDNEG
jgi:hypothetical protein